MPLCPLEPLHLISSALHSEADNGFVALDPVSLCAKVLSLFTALVFFCVSKIRRPTGPWQWIRSDWLRGMLCLAGGGRVLCVLLPGRYQDLCPCLWSQPLPTWLFSRGGAPQVVGAVLVWVQAEAGPLDKACVEP